MSGTPWIALPNYLLLAESLYGSDSGPWWEELGDLLGGRPGWHCEFTSDSMLWSFGAVGSSLFNIGAPDDGFPNTTYTIFDYDEDETHVFNSTSDLRAWLEQNESRHEDYMRVGLHDWAGDDDWRLLKAFQWQAEVTCDGSSWIGTIPSIPSEATFATSLAELVANLRELVAHAFGAPESVAPEVSMSVRLDEKATAALTG